MTSSLGTVIITGANGGLGSAFVKRFVEGNYPYYGIFTVRARNPSSSGTVENLVSSTTKGYDIVTLDLTSLDAVRNFAKEINHKVADRKIPPIRALVLNAALQQVKGMTFTTDGYETMFAVNYLANFLLVLLLLKSMDKDHGRIVFVSSFTHDPSHYMCAAFATDKIIFKDPEVMAKPVDEVKKGDDFRAGMRRYARTKLLLLMFM
jgi:NAD(P)-dependent dehydrogenase (short-subunit alcohol dehydrogenase family)